MTEQTDNTAYKDAYGKWGGRPNGVPPDFTKCCEQVWTTGRFSLPHQCTKPRGHGPGLAYCKIHDPDRVNAKRAARQAEWGAKVAEAKQKGIERERLERLNRECLAAIRAIAAGHNDPQELARTVLADNGEPTS